jgi:hydroxyethylthiazole kinase-like uncharacterized protein yjeF
MRPKHRPIEAPEPLLTTAESAAVDRAALAEGLSIDALIDRAGAAVAAEVEEALGRRGGIAILCGPGNNGADGYAAAAALQRAGYAVRCFAARPPNPEAAVGRAAALWRGKVEAIAGFDAGGFDAVVDALYGAGLSRPIEDDEAAALLALETAALVVAVDVPSGLDGDSGQPLGPHAAADRTVTFFRRKPGHLLWPGRGLCGRLAVADIGLATRHIPTGVACFANAPALWRGALPEPGLSGHKYDRGYVLAVSGPEFQTGAARLAATAALNAGAGAVALAGDPAALRIHAAHVTAIMLKIAEDAAALAGLLGERRFGAAVIGPAAGIEPGTAAKVEALLAAGVPTVLDADALTSLGGDPARLSRRPHTGSALVLTPHSGEFGKLFGPVLAQDAAYAALPSRLQASKLEQARAAARLADAVVILKGVDSVIAAPDGRAAINENAGPELATAGSGDVLAGIAASHLAQGFPPFEAAAAAVWLHAAAGAAYGPGLTADRLAAGLRPLAAYL